MGETSELAQRLPTRLSVSGLLDRMQEWKLAGLRVDWEAGHSTRSFTFQLWASEYFFVREGDNTLVATYKKRKWKDREVWLKVTKNNAKRLKTKRGIQLWNSQKR